MPHKADRPTHMPHKADQTDQHMHTQDPRTDTLQLFFYILNYLYIELYFSDKLIISNIKNTKNIYQGLNISFLDSKHNNKVV